MTNKEYLATLSADEWCTRVDWLYHFYANQFISQLFGITNWLDKEYSKERPILSTRTEYPCYYCPVCYSPVAENAEKCHKCVTEIEWSTAENNI